MIGLLFDFLMAGILMVMIIVNIQFLTGVGMGRGFSILKIHFRCEGERNKKISYSFWKDDSVLP